MTRSLEPQAHGDVVVAAIEGKARGIAVVEDYHAEYHAKAAGDPCRVVVAFVLADRCSQAKHQGFGVGDFGPEQPLDFGIGAAVGVGGNVDAPPFGHGNHARDARLERHGSVFVFAVVGGHIARVGEGRTEGHIAVHLEGAADVAQDGVGRFVFDGLACEAGGNTPVEGGITATEAKLCGPGVGAVVPCLETVFVATFDVVVTEVIQTRRESEFVRKRKAVVNIDETVRTHAVKDNLVQAELWGFHGTHG